MQSYKGKEYVTICVILISALLFLFVIPSSFSQNVVNNGDNIVINQGANVVISGDYTNLTSNGDGKIDLDGEILINGNWKNNASDNVFINTEPVPDGYVIMRGSLPQYIGGANSTNFENLSLVNSKKTLLVTNCEVKGILALDAVLDLNKKKIIIDNSSPSSINYISNYILSETSPLDGYGEVQWNIGNSVNTYKIPFGSGEANNDDLELALSTKTSGLPSSGSISFATYPTDCNNDILPTGVMSLDYDASLVANRYWIINPEYSISKPNIDIIFQYTMNDVDACNQNITRENLKAIRYNTSLFTWGDIPPSGLANKNAKTVSVNNVLQNDFFAPWALVESPTINFFIPNAFTPGNDNLNDFFGPVGIDITKYTFTMYIFDRWGGMIFKTEKIDQFWNGKLAGSNEFAPIGVYAWLITLCDQNKQKHDYEGTVTLIR